MEQNWRPVEEMDRTHRWLMRCIWAIVVIISLGLLWSIRSEARAQGQRCAPLGAIEKNLAEQHKEKRIGFGVVSAAEVLLIYATKDGSTFTVLTLNSQGIACLVSSGVDLNLDGLTIGEGV